MNTSSMAEEPLVTADEQPAASADRPRTRRQLLSSGGWAAMAGILGLLGVSSATQARDGQWLKAGSKNSASSPTQLQAKSGPSFLARIGGGGKAPAIRGLSTSSKGTGVQGWADAKKGKTIGVAGATRSPAGTAGRFVAANGGTALHTEGRLEFKGRSGVSPLSGGSELVVPVGGGLSESSMVFANLQDHVPGVYVEAASVVDKDVIVVRLNQAVAEPVRVAWLVLG